MNINEKKRILSGAWNRKSEFPLKNPPGKRIFEVRRPMQTQTDPFFPLVKGLYLYTQTHPVNHKTPDLQGFYEVPAAGIEPVRGSPHTGF